MEKEIYFPKGAKSINFDLEKGIATAIYEEEKPALKVEEWYYNVFGYYVLKTESGAMVGFNDDGVWQLSIKFKPLDVNDFKPADMSKVKELLIKEAEKKGLTGKGKIKSPCGNYTNKIRTYGKNLFLNAFGSLCIGDKDSVNGIILFESRTGKWAEIVEEKKPLYINAYGTEFFEGDYPYFIQFYGLEIIKGLEPMPNNGTFSASEEFTEIMTEAECHRYLYQNWDELHK